MSSTAGDWVPDPSGGAREDWKAGLIKGRNGPAPVLANAVTALRNDPAWRGVFAFDELGLCAVIRKESPLGVEPREVGDHEDRLTATWLQHQGILVGPETAGQAVQVVARDCRFHPVRDYLDGLKWDGTLRLSGWANLYLGVEPSDYSAAVARAFLVGATARIYNPGAKMDTVLILEGEQGIKKSTALKTMFTPWFTDQVAEVGSKDASMQILGKWGIEFAELDALLRSSPSRIKAFTSRTEERFRPPYGKHLLAAPRQCVFAGSVNHTAYLRDETGGRRFWPIRCSRVLIDELARDRDQLWAEALVAYKAGESWWLQTAALNSAAAAEQAERYDVGPWDDAILDWVEERVRGGFDSVSVAEVLDLCIKKPQALLVKADSMRVGSCLTAAGWQRYRDRQSGKWRYRQSVPTGGYGLGGGNGEKSQ
jgi:predicted P-loop ATPase